MQSLEIDGHIFPIQQWIETLPNVDLIKWLDSQPIYPKVFWKQRDCHVTRAAVGNLLSFTHIPRFSISTPDLRLYGGIRFAPKRDDDETWRGFPNTCFWLPQIEVSQEKKTTQAIHYFLNEQPLIGARALGEMRTNDYSLEEIAKLPAPEKSMILSQFVGAAMRPALHRRAHTQESSARRWSDKVAQKGDFAGAGSFAIPSLLNRQERPCQESWSQGVAKALEEIASGHIAKIVMARKTACLFAKPISVWPLFHHLLQKARNATLFAFQLSPTLCFMGATPEKLFQRNQNLVNTDAIAATRARGKTPEEDLQLEQDLLSDPKELREFALVKDFLNRALSPLSDRLKWEGVDRILKTSHVQHIHNRLHATLKNGISDADLIKALHPTPALGGSPRTEALSFLQKIEPFDRGWYGAPVGVISPQHSTFYVAIRSALIRESTIHLFAGTGLVKGSIALREWEELEEKIRPFTEMFTYI